MIKLSANVSKKVPVPDVQYSSQSYSAGMEIELSSGTAKDELKSRLRALYELLEEAVDEQIGERGKTNPGHKRAAPNAKRPPSSCSSGNAERNGRRATKAQLRAICAIAKEHGYSDQNLKGLVSEACGADAPSALSIAQASSLIDTLKGNGKE